MMKFKVKSVEEARQILRDQFKEKPHKEFILEWTARAATAYGEEGAKKELDAAVAKIPRIAKRERGLAYRKVYRAMAKSIILYFEEALKYDEEVNGEGADA